MNRDAPDAAAGRDSPGMSEQFNARPDLSRRSTIGTSEPPVTEPQSLRCQWCSVPLEAGISICPTCGSPGIPDPRMTVPSVTVLEPTPPDPIREALSGGIASVDEAELVEWWNEEKPDDVIGAAPITTVDFEEIERRRMQSIIFMVGSVFVFALLGWLIGPTLLVGPFEGLTGTTVEDPSDLRGMGTMGGLIAGMFVGATGGWVLWSAR